MIYENVTHIILHCSATPEGRQNTAADIDRWHKAKGWRKIGYHYVVEHTKICRGRALNETGAHAKGNNRDTWGVCYIGGTDVDGNPKDTRTKGQDALLTNLLIHLKAMAPNAKIIGHNEVSTKACPSFDVQAAYGWLND